MVVSRFTSQAASASQQPVDFHACAQTCFEGAHRGMNNQQVAANLAAMNNLDVAQRGV